VVAPVSLDKDGMTGFPPLQMVLSALVVSQQSDHADPSL